MKDWILEEVLSHCGPLAVQKVKEAENAIKSTSKELVFLKNFGAISRHVSKSPLILNSMQEHSWKQRVLVDWVPQWNHDDWARVGLLLTYANSHSDQFEALLTMLLEHASVRESCILYQCLWLLPSPQNYVAAAQEGVRSNMTSVFNSVALNNPYPAKYFPEDAWNQMVLKAVFISSPVQQIIGLQERFNKELLQMLTDFSEEREAANREISDDLKFLLGLVH